MFVSSLLLLCFCSLCIVWTFFAFLLSSSSSVLHPWDPSLVMPKNGQSVIDRNFNLEYSFKIEFFHHSRVRMRLKHPKFEKLAILNWFCCNNTCEVIYSVWKGRVSLSFLKSRNIIEMQKIETFFRIFF